MDGQRRWLRICPTTQKGPERALTKHGLNSLIFLQFCDSAHESLVCHAHMHGIMTK